MLDALQRRAHAITHAAPRITLVSNLGRSVAPGTGPDARYWRRHAREPVRFAACIEALKAAGVTVLVEIGPHPTLVALAARGVPEATWTPVASLRRGRDDVRDPQAVATLYVRGAPIHWAALTARRRVHRIALPPSVPARAVLDGNDQPTSHQRWPHGSRFAGVTPKHAGCCGALQSVSLRADPAWLQDHRVGAEVVMPFTGCVEAALAAMRVPERRGLGFGGKCELGAPLVLPDSAERVMQVVVEHAGSDGHRAIRVYRRDAAHEEADWLQHATLHVPIASGAATQPRLEALEQTLEGQARPQSPPSTQQAFTLDCGNWVSSSVPVFKVCGRAGRWRRVALAELELPLSLQAEANRYLVHPALLDACLHAGPQAIRSVSGMDSAARLPAGGCPTAVPGNRLPGRCAVWRACASPTRAPR